MPKQNFEATTTAEGHLKASDAAAHSKAILRREGSWVTVQDAYRFDLTRLVDVDAGYLPREVTDEAALTRDEVVVSTAIHGAFGLGTFNAVLDRVHSPWAQAIYDRTQVGRPFLVRSLSSHRDDYFVVPVFFRGRWAVACHVGLAARGTYYSNGYTVPDMPTEGAEAASVYGRQRLDRLIVERFEAPVAPPERVYAETSPPQHDAVLGYLWRVETPRRHVLVDVCGRVATLSPEQSARIRAGARLDAPIAF
ncbi:MAG TPA: hypothetical protein V6D00_06825 [Pantanalinema sp.]